MIRFDVYLEVKLIVLRQLSSYELHHLSAINSVLAAYFNKL